MLEHSASVVLGPGRVLVSLSHLGTLFPLVAWQQDGFGSDWLSPNILQVPKDSLKSARTHLKALLA